MEYYSYEKFTGTVFSYEKFIGTVFVDSIIVFVCVCACVCVRACVWEKELQEMYLYKISRTVIIQLEKMNADRIQSKDHMP